MHFTLCWKKATIPTEHVCLKSGATQKFSFTWPAVHTWGDWYWIMISMSTISSVSHGSEKSCPTEIRHLQELEADKIPLFEGVISWPTRHPTQVNLEHPHVAFAAGVQVLLAVTALGVCIACSQPWFGFCWMAMEPVVIWLLSCPGGSDSFRSYFTLVIHECDEDDASKIFWLNGLRAVG